MAANANWDNPTLSSTYTDFVTEVKNRDLDAATQFNGSTGSDNVPLNAVQWDASANRWNKHNGSDWIELSSTYSLSALNVTGSTLPSNGIYLQATNTPTFTSNGVKRLEISPNGAFGLSGGNYGTAGQVITSNGSGSAPTYQTPWLIQSYAVIEHIESSGTDGGGSTTSYKERVLNVRSIDPDNIVTLVGTEGIGQTNTRFKLQAGYYIIEGSLPTWRSNRSASRLVQWDSDTGTTATILKYGSNTFSQSSYGGYEYSQVFYRLQVEDSDVTDGTNVYGFQTKVQSANGTHGFGEALGGYSDGAEHYSFVKIMKEAG